MAPAVAEKTEKRATLKELQAFANRVRKAGGGNPIDALMPAVPEDVSRCLIARNLNFNCQVAGTPDWYDFDDRPTDAPEGAWWMSVEDKTIADRIAAELGTRSYKTTSEVEVVDNKGHSDWETRESHSIMLPKKIGLVARDFDTVVELADRLDDALNYQGLGKRAAWDELTRPEKKLFRDMWKYVEASKKEAYGLASIVNDDGSIVI